MTTRDASNDRPPSARTEIRRHRERAHYDRATVDAVLREGLICHVAFVEGGQPCVIPTTYAPYDDGAATRRVLDAVLPTLSPGD